MRLIFGKSKWEMWAEPVEAFLQRARNDGFEATEIFLATVREAPAEVARLHAQYQLPLVGQIISQGESPADHRESLEAQFALAVECQAVLVNGHLGRDIFAFEDNVRLLERALALSRESNIPLVVETHRGRPTYSAIETRRYLEALPDLRLTADFSHWMVVHESDLSDQPENVQLAIERSDYIHARVGHAEGPQVAHPGAPEWQPAVQAHCQLWQRLIDTARATGKEALHITPEFGPPSYMPTLPFTGQPVADTWAVNVYMKDRLKALLTA